MRHRATAAMTGSVAVRPAATTKPSRQPPACTASPVTGAATAMPAALAEFIHVFACVYTRGSVVCCSSTADGIRIGAIAPPARA
jgi:hypothetical protein